MKALLLLFTLTIFSNIALAEYEYQCYWQHNQVCTTTTEEKKVCHKEKDTSDDGYKVVCNYYPETVTTCEDDPEWVCEYVYVP